ncbi:hypothetical protein N7495_000680 [Penicillium taxi]|uniref:uncharacterized protein n=1 Tax=Penicillium taxi TaxID=168475 RepID=UPI002544DE7B|nr:uncharacterized protein N7495_000680 [Penicillium taxi]KAJ5907998.1 hypothetical protein N7495_000680 [Penicillium taxi]
MAQSTEIFEQLRSYRFTEDPEFANGLAIILGHPDRKATAEEINQEDDLVLQAKCFFFSRNKQLSPAIDYAGYKTWLTSTAPDNQPRELKPIKISSSSSVDAEESPSPDPSYPSSFVHIAELIATGQPIPGIQEIPDTVLEGHDITSEKPRRQKPWERNEA